MEKNDQDTLNWKEIGQRFKEMRERGGYSQLQLGKLANQNREAISHYELGVIPASTNYALFLRNEFGASFDWLYDGSDTLIKHEDKHTKRSLDPHAIGARLKGIRKEKGLTQKGFGDWIGIPNTNISVYEKGIQKPEIKTARKIKKALNKPLDWIYFGDECIITRSKATMATTPYKPSLPLKQLKKELKEETISYIKNMDVRDLSMLATRLRMEENNKVTLSETKTYDEQLNSTQLNSTQLNSTQLNSTQLNSTQLTLSKEKRKVKRIIPILRQFFVNWIKEQIKKIKEQIKKIQGVIGCLQLVEYPLSGKGE